MVERFVIILSPSCTARCITLARKGTRSKDHRLVGMTFWGWWGWNPRRARGLHAPMTLTHTRSQDRSSRGCSFAILSIRSFSYQSCFANNCVHEYRNTCSSTRISNRDRAERRKICNTYRNLWPTTCCVMYAERFTALRSEEARSITDL